MFPNLELRSGLQVAPKGFVTFQPTLSVVVRRQHKKHITPEIMPNLRHCHICVCSIYKASPPAKYRLISFADIIHEFGDVLKATEGLGMKIHTDRS